MEILIYTLEDPITNEVRYVGKTRPDQFIKRYRAHCNPHPKADRNIHKLNWVNRLKKNNLKPIMKVIDSTTENDWEYLEQYWISQMKSWGFNLVNQTDGGDNPPVNKFNSEETRKRQRKARKDLKPIRVWNNIKKEKDGRFGVENIVSKDFVGEFKCGLDFIRDYIGLDRYENPKEFNLWNSKMVSICNKRYGRKSYKGYHFEYIDGDTND